jgi:hypothetical protein
LAIDQKKTLVADLFSLVTDRVRLTWSGSGGQGEDARGRCVVLARRDGATLIDGTWRRGVPDPVATDMTITAGPPLFEETSYSVLLSATGSGSVELRHRDPRLLLGLSLSRDGRTIHGSVNFHSQIGRSRFSVLVDGRPEFDFEVEVSPSKLDYETDYAELTAEVQSILNGLVLQYLGSTFEGAALEGAGSTELEWALVLRHIIGELEQALRYISSRPVRGLHRKREFVRVDQLRRSDSGVRHSVLRGRGKGPLQQVSDGLYTRRYLPERRAKPTLDTPEHRWLASRIATARRRLAAIYRATHARAVATYPEAVPSRLAKTLMELEQLEARLNRLLKLEPLQAAEGAPPQGFESLQLQGAPGYREAYHACISLSRGLRLSGGPVELSLKDLHLLYEYWCFLSIVRLVGDVLGQPIPAEQLLAVEQDGLRVRLQKGREQKVTFGLGGREELSVYYSPQFSGQDYLLAQKPDISLTLSRAGWPTVRLVLDAKYRVDNSGTYVDQMGAPGPPFDAINVLHRYRDAILERRPGASAHERGLRTVVEGVALFPLSGAEAAGFEGTKMWGSLGRLGIGALPFLPSEKEYVRIWLEGVLARSGWTVAERDIPSGSREQLHAWRSAASEPVLVGVLRPDGDAHMAWIRKHRAYYTPFTPSQPLQLAAKAIAFYGGAHSSSPSSVWLVAQVEAIEMRPRCEIDTPWPARGDPDDSQVLYRLGEFEELDTPVRNVRGERFSTNRWTSRLGLTRATRLEQLYLETEPEWRLYDELSLGQIRFDVEPGQPKERNAADPRGRAWFRFDGDTRAQYRGLAGWLVESPRGDAYLPNVDAVIDAVAAQ